MADLKLSELPIGIPAHLVSVDMNGKSILSPIEAFKELVGIKTDTQIIIVSGISIRVASIGNMVEVGISGIATDNIDRDIIFSVAVGTFTSDRKGLFNGRVTTRDYNVLYVSIPSGTVFPVGYFQSETYSRI